MAKFTEKRLVLKGLSFEEFEQYHLLKSPKNFSDFYEINCIQCQGTLTAT